MIGASLAAARDIALAPTNPMPWAPNGHRAGQALQSSDYHWPNGRPVTFVMRSPSAPEMKIILEKVLRHVGE